MDSKDKQVPSSVGEFAVGERDKLLARVAELEAAQKIEIDWDSGNGSDAVPAIDRAIEEIAAAANKHNDNDWFQEAEQIARYALTTALYNTKLLADTLAALKQPSAGVDERPIATCQRGQFETWTMETEHPVFGYIGSDWLDHGDDPNTYANDYMQGAWVMFQARAQLAAPAGVPMQHGVPVYQLQCREIGEGDWFPCDHRHYTYCQKSPEMDTRIVDVVPASAVVPVPRESLLEAIAVLMLYTRGSGSREGVLIGDFRALLNGGRS